MISAFEAGLIEVGGIGRASMTFTARRDVARRAEMMTGRASFIHVRHLRMYLVVEMDWAVLIDQLVKKHGIGSLGDSVLANRLRPGKIGAGFKAGFVGGGAGAGVTFEAIELQYPHVFFPGINGLGRA